MCELFFIVVKTKTSLLTL